ncbi:translation initiation factor [Lithospermum erythrorhizon]|uniref:Translation initiation factor n=1 Tax=Lithospermum erythrorhizon TaxID=34254 RepID=A0AAV3RPM8_LITER
MNFIYLNVTFRPVVKFNGDESVGFRIATNEVQFYDPGDFSKGFVNRLRVQGVAAVELSKTPQSYVAVFVPESKGMPASVQIFACGKDLQSLPIARRSFFRCSTVQMSWNNGSTGLLIVVQADVDKTNQSYYGESKLNYLTTDSSHDGLVPLRKEGPVHDVQWSSTGKEFAVVYGFMPAMATIFDKKCKPLLELGSGSYNTIRFLFPPIWFALINFYLVLCLAGFGNLPGDMAFWDYMEKKQLGTTKAECSVTSEWSPDGRYFMTATTAPRLQVDNGVKIFHHNGNLYFKKMFAILFCILYSQADWKPESPEMFVDIEVFVKSVDSLKIEEPKSQGSKATSGNAQAQKPAAYRPPQAKAIQAEGNEQECIEKQEETGKSTRERRQSRELLDLEVANQDIDVLVLIDLRLVWTWIWSKPGALAAYSRVDCVDLILGLRLDLRSTSDLMDLLQTFAVWDLLWALLDSELRAVWSDSKQVLKQRCFLLVLQRP